MKRKSGTKGLTGRQINRAAHIDSFIPEAEKKARIRLIEHLSAGGMATEVREGCGFVRGSSRYDSYVHDFYSEFFHEAMNELTREAGLRTI